MYYPVKLFLPTLYIIKRSCHNNVHKLQYVPQCPPTVDSDIEKLKDLLVKSKNIFVLTGAGISTESGIPDYRSEGVGLYARSKRGPITIQQFLSNESSRKRYWARNYVGWPRFSTVLPNTAHTTLYDWEKNGFIRYLVTQNVDFLHQKSGSNIVLDLHGTAFKVICIACRKLTCRHEFQRILEQRNNIKAEAVEIRPDGDVDLSQEDVDGFSYPPCDCGGILKPDIVFYGDNVRKEKVELIYQHVEDSDCLLVLGSSLTVFSAFRFIIRAREKGIPVGMVNIGPTRGDNYATCKVHGRCGEVLPKIVWQ